MKQGFEYASGTAPWSAHLANYFIRKVDVVNRRIGGYTTRGYKNVFDTAVAELDPKAVGAVVIFLGANDCVNNNNPGHVPIPEYKDNLKNHLPVYDRVCCD